MSPERILVVTTSFPEVPGDPSGHFVASEATQLARSGHDVVVIAPGRNRVVDGVQVLGVSDRGAFGWPGALARIGERPGRALGALGFARGARRALREHAHDRVIAHWLLPTGWPIATASSEAIEVVAHGSDVRLFLRLPAPLRARITSELLERGAHFRCVSHDLARKLIASDPRVAARLRVEPTLLDTRGAPSRSAAREALGLGKDERWLVVIGRLVTDKRTAVALGAAELVPNAHVAVLGDGPEARHLRGRFPSARFTGRLRRDQALTWIAAADVVLSASRSEGAPTVLREARALGVPVVTTLAGDLERWAEADPGLWTVS